MVSFHPKRRFRSKFKGNTINSAMRQPGNRTTRRALISLSAAAIAAPGALLAQAVKRVYSVGILEGASENTHAPEWSVFRRRLRELGLTEGENVSYDVRFAKGFERLPMVAAELASAKPDIIVCPDTASARAAIRATASIPIVFTAAADPAGSGLVASLSRPGGNATGFSMTATETYQKALEMLLEIAPRLQRFAYLSDTANPGVMTIYSRLEERARKLKLSSRLLDGGGQTALDRSFATIRQERLQGLIVGASGTVLDFRDQIVGFAAQERIPVVYGLRAYVIAGGLLSHGIHRTPLFVRAAELTHRILKGAKPAEIPVEQIATIHTALNVKTARALGIKIPDSIRLRADEVIE